MAKEKYIIECAGCGKEMKYSEELFKKGREPLCKDCEKEFEKEV